MASNPVLILTHNNLALTKKCVESCRKQDILPTVYVVDNCSSDGTPEWAKAEGILLAASDENTGFSKGINFGLGLIFSFGAQHCLVANNDTILHRSLYSALLAYDLPFVSGRETVLMSDLDRHLPEGELGGGPQFSCFLIRKDAWEKIGPLDETMKTWASDCDYHLRAHRLGIELSSAPVPYYHERSSTLNNASPKEKRQMQLQADSDRLQFAEKWKFEVGSEAYKAAFSPENFGWALAGFEDAEPK